MVIYAISSLGYMGTSQWLPTGLVKIPGVPLKMTHFSVPVRDLQIRLLIHKMIFRYPEYGTFDEIRTAYSHLKFYWAYSHIIPRPLKSSK